LARPRKAPDPLLFGLAESVHNGHKHKQGQSKFKKKGKKQRKHFFGGGAIGWPFQACAKCSANWARTKKRAKYWVTLLIGTKCGVVIRFGPLMPYVALGGKGSL